MKKSRFTDEQIIAMIKEQEAGRGRLRLGAELYAKGLEARISPSVFAG